jgi:histidyl-tRNA synthetase
VANNLNARYALIVGEDEIQSGSYLLRDMTTGEQQKLEETDLINTLKR